MAHSPARRGARQLRGGVGILILLLAWAAIPSRPAFAQLKSPIERIQELEKANEELQARMEALEAELKEGAAGEAAASKSDADGEPFYADGVFTIGGVKLELGGEVSILLIDVESESDPIVGSTENPDPHFELNRFRLEPRLLFNKEISVDSQIDIRPEQGDTYLRELTARYNMERPVWWFDLRAEVGLDDRFMFLSRRTKTYPLAGTAFWHRESLAFTLEALFGDPAGPPEEVVTTAPAELDQDLGSVVVVKREDPFDILENPGELGLFFSIGQGYTLDSDEIGNDGASFNQIVADSRDLETSLALRELGFGLRYRRDCLSLGEIELFGYYFNDELSDASLEYLENELTLVVGGVPTKGYGTLNSDSRKSERYGAQIEYLLPASTIFGKDADVRGKDGLRLAGQWMRAYDGELRRDGWFVQGSYRYSFPSSKSADGGKSRGLIADRYIRSLEPIVRYGSLDVNLDPAPELPGLWDRQDLLVGLIIEVTGEVFIKVEYMFNWEDTGASASQPGPSSVGNDQLLVELLLAF